ncbi:serine/threonine protein kinase, partial [Rathayibacter sp. AY2B5]
PGGGGLPGRRRPPERRPPAPEAGPGARGWQDGRRAIARSAMV